MCHSTSIGDTMSFTFNVTLHLVCFNLYFQYTWLTRTYWREKTIKASTPSFFTPDSMNCRVKSSTARFENHSCQEIEHIYRKFWSTTSESKNNKRKKKTSLIICLLYYGMLTKDENDVILEKTDSNNMQLRQTNRWRQKGII